MSRSTSTSTVHHGGRRALIAGLVWAAAIVLAHLLDAWAFAHLRLPALQDSDLGRMLRVLGFLPTWGIVAVAMSLERDRRLPPRPRFRPGLLLLASATFGGIVAELLKMLIRRERPLAEAAGYAFRAYSDAPFHTGGLGMPSSHALVAFAAVAMMARLHPRSAALWWLLGAGCAFSRIAAGAHYLSDVVAAGAVGYFLAMILARWWRDADETARVANDAPAAKL